ncbi:MAG TPA: hypothetical protein VLE50_02360 [Cellvibrio sp.]|nr:hypothetical protein [Cellvibrio sp.]
MNRQDSNNPLPLWLTLLVLPILAFAVYLQFNKTREQVAPEVAAPENAAVFSAAAGRSTNINTNVPASLDVPEAPPEITETPAGLDPEAARAAVHKVENGVYERATAMFEQEPIDVEWAGSYEQSLREMFSRHQGLQRVSVNSISCHTSMCRIEAFTPRDTDADFFTAMFYDALATFRAGELKAEAAIARRMEQGMTSVYVARKGHTLGFY